MYANDPAARNRHPCGLIVLGLALALGITGCTRSTDSAADAADDGFEHYPLTGEILSVDPDRNVLVVQHEAIADLMPAMVMEFEVTAGDIAITQAGRRIRADLVETAPGAFRLEKIWPDDPVASSRVQAAGNTLRQDTLIRGQGVYREVGEAMPDFALYDQDGTVVEAGRFRGRYVMVNFIYTRCPVATMCPAATAKMMAAQQLVHEAGLDDRVSFVSFTLDPEYDTPGILHEYAAVRGIDTSNFSFLTGPERAIRDLLQQFGVIAEFDGGVMKHSLATLLIDPNGRIIHRADGSLWEPEAFLARLPHE